MKEELKNNRDIVYGPGSDNYGRDKKRTLRPFNEMNFTEFQVQLRCCLIITDGFDNEWMQDFYSDFREDYNIGRYNNVKEWAEYFFQEVNLDTHSYCLVSSLFDRPTPSLTAEELTDKVQYDDALKGSLSNEHIKLVNMLADKEPSCYADIADIMLEYSAQKDARIKELTEALEEISPLLYSCANAVSFIDGGGTGAHSLKEVASALMKKYKSAREALNK